MRFYLLLISFVSFSIFAQISEQTGVDNLSPNAKLCLNYPNNNLFPLVLNNSYPVTFWYTHSVVPVPYTSKFNHIYTAWLTIEQMQVLAKSKYLKYLDVGGRLNSPKPCMDSVRSLTFTNQVHNGKNIPANMGEKAIVGIVDLGFESTHPNFMNSDGSQTRIKSWWQQNDNTGTKPNSFNYGSNFTTWSTIKNVVENDGSHGTHVAGISAGSGFSSLNNQFAGIAPASDMVWVSIKHTNDTIKSGALGDYIVANNTILDGYAHIFNYAAAVNKPAVTNLSWGSHTGPHDGSSLFDKAVEAIAGKGKIIVGSAGNSARENMHAMFPFNKLDTMHSWIIDRSRNNYTNENVYVDLWGSKNDSFKISISVFDTFGSKLINTPYYTSNGKSYYNQISTNGTDSLIVTILPNAKYAGNNKPEILIMVETNNASKQRILLSVIGKNTIHGWNSGRTYNWTSGSFVNAVRGNATSNNNKFINGDENYTCGENGGTGKSTISVGSYVARNDWFDADNGDRGQAWLKVGQISNFSSKGPTVDGRTKPDIVAPGQNVGSSYDSRFLGGWQNEYTLLRSNWNAEQHVWVLLSGTSMSGPVVAGAVALMLDANPNLDNEQVKAILKNNAIKDTFTTLNDSNNTYGFGKLNVYKAVLEATRLAGTTHITKINQWFYPNPTNKYLFISEPIKEIEIFTIHGALVGKRKVENGKVDLENFGFGLYLIRANNLPISKLLIQ